MAAHGTQFAAALPRLNLPCELAEFDHLLDDPFQGLEVKRGSISVSDAPDSGISIRKASMAAFTGRKVGDTTPLKQART